MCITGSLTDFSLPEIFRLLGKGHHTGLLTVHTDVSTPVTPNGVCYVWIYRGRIVAVDSQLEHLGLIKLIAQRQWMDRWVVNPSTNQMVVPSPNLTTHLYLVSTQNR